MAVKITVRKQWSPSKLQIQRKGGDLHVELSEAEEVAEPVKGLLHMQEALCFIPGTALTRCIGMSL